MKKNKIDTISRKIMNIIIYISPFVWFSLITVNYIDCHIPLGSGIISATGEISMAVVYCLIVVAVFRFLYVSTDFLYKDLIFGGTLLFGLLLALYVLVQFITYYWEIAIPACKVLCFIMTAVVMSRLLYKMLIKNNRKVVYWIIAAVLSAVNTMLAILSNAMWTDLRYNLPQFNLDYTYFIWNELHYRIDNMK